MKKLMQGILIGTCSLLLLAGCSEKESENTPSTTTETKPTTEKNQTAQATSPQNTITQVKLFERKSLFSIPIRDDKGNDYTLFVYSPNQKTYSNTEPSFLGMEGDTMYEGKYELALAKEGDTKVTPQPNIKIFPEHEGYDLVFNQNMTNYAVTTTKDRDIVALFQQETTNDKSAELLYVHDGKLVQLTKDKTLYLTQPTLKWVNPTLFQTVSYDNGMEENSGWIFNTWKVDLDKGTYDLSEKKIYNDQLMDGGLAYGKNLAEKWKNSESYVHAYQPITLTKKFLTEGQNGRLVGSDFAIGTELKTVQEKLGQPINKGDYEGAIVYSYEDVSYFTQDDQYVSGILMDGARINKTLTEVQDILGKPDEAAFNEMEQEDYIVYYFGEDKGLSFNADPVTKQVTSIWLY